MATFADLTNSDVPVLIDFSAEWCGPCKMLAPILKDVATQMGDDARIVKIDVDRNPEIAGSLNIMAVPTLMVYKKGEMLWRQSGVVPAAQLVQVLKSYAN
jgi:thioredoxin 1